jgi:hypothetical protein
LLRYFRINDPYRLAGLLAILLVIYLPLFIGSQALTLPELKNLLVGEKVSEGFAPYSELIDSTPPLTAWINALVDMVFGRSLLARHILAFILLFFQSVYLGIIFIDKKAFTENTFIPSVIFSILIFFSFDTLALSGELYGLGFLLLALNSLFKEIEFKVQRDETVFNLGLFIALSSLCSFANTMYLLAALGILAFYTRSSPRKYILMIFGFLLPHALLASVYFMYGELGMLWNNYYVPNLSFQSSSYFTIRGLLMLGAVPLVYLVVSVVILNREARFSKYQSQLLQAMFLWLLSSFPLIAFSRDMRPQTLIVLMPSLTFFITHFLLLIRRKRFAEINLWVLLISVVSIAYLSRFGKIDSINYGSLIVPGAPVVTGKKILVLGDNIAAYRTNELGSGFCDWSLAKAIFEDPDAYENVVMVYQSLKSDPPDVIIDPENRMQAFFKRIPELQKAYTRTNETTFVRR